MDRRALLTSALAGLALLAQPALAAPERQLLLSVDFAPRPVAQVEAGWFRFEPGQPAPIHTHAAPAIGVVTSGTILYQVEGQAMQVLKPGDAFYEPVGPRILHFDNASATEEAVFIDLNLEQEGEPFIIFPAPPTARIDRRSQPTHLLGGVVVSHAEAWAETLRPGRVLGGRPERPGFGIVLEGAVLVRVAGQAPVRVERGGSYHRPVGVDSQVLPASGTARVASFELR